MKRKSFKLQQFQQQLTRHALRDAHETNETTPSDTDSSLMGIGALFLRGKNGMTE